MFTACSVNAEVLIPANDTTINYFGRFDFSTPSQPKFNWSGSTIEAAFPGPSIGISLHDGQSDYDIEIDGALNKIIRTSVDTSHYTISVSLSAQRHTIRIVQRSENHWSVATFGGFYIADGKQLLAPPAKPAKKIEFIGDSYTVGYGNESPGRTCTTQQLRNFTNTNRSFATLITKAFHAQSIIAAWSGEGMVRNYGDAAKKSATPYPYYYNSTLGGLAGAWNFQQWIPDLAVICLGTNDFSTTPYPDDSMFTNAYHAFIGRVKGNYPNASIVCVSTPTGRCDILVQRIVNEETTIAGRSNIYYSAFPQTLTWSGCDGHPTIADDSLIAGVLIKNIIKNCGWDTSSSSAVHPRHGYQNPKPDPAFKKAGRLIFFNAQTSVSSSKVKVMDVRGNLITEGDLNGNRTFAWNTSNVSSGVYLFGFPATGWTRVFLKN